jgi:hypothetical protein
MGMRKLDKKSQDTAKFYVIKPEDIMKMYILNNETRLHGNWKSACQTYRLNNHVTVLELGISL